MFQLQGLPRASEALDFGRRIQISRPVWQRVCRHKTSHSVRVQAQEISGSNLISQEVFLFVFQQDLESTLVRALNTDRQELAQDIRERLQAIDAVVQEIQTLKSTGGEAQGEGEAGNNFEDSFRLRSSLQEAIMEERYEEAARLRDELRVLQEKLDSASGKQEAASESLKTQRKLRLGQRVMHKENGYRAVICGWDASCSESEDWQTRAGIPELTQGPNQPFYLLLVDVRDIHKLGEKAAGFIAYVPQESLLTVDTRHSWAEEFGGDGFVHPLKHKLFLGGDERGDFLPARALREKYSQERRDVYPSDDEEEGEESDLENDASNSLTTGSSSDADMLNRLFGRSDDDAPEDGKRLN